MSAIKPAASAILTDKTAAGEPEAIVSSIKSLVIQEIIRSIKTGREIQPYVLAHVTTFPAIAGVLGRSVTERPELLAHVLADPDILVTFLTMNYEEFAEQFEERLLGNGMGQYICELLEWAKVTETKLRRPIGYYQQFLVRDPYWAVQVNRLFPSGQMMKAVAECAVLERKQSASAAFYYLLARPDEPLTEEYASLFREDIQYAYLALRTLFTRGFKANFINTNKLTPRWAYHFLTYGAAIPEEACELSLLKSPEWLVEYLVSADLWSRDRDKVNSMYPACIKSCHPNPAVRLLHMWHKRRKDTEAGNN